MDGRGVSDWPWRSLAKVRRLKPGLRTGAEAAATVSVCRQCEQLAGGAFALRRRAGEQALDVFGEEVGFEVHGVADLALMQGGDGEGVRDDPKAETFREHFGHGEADAIDGDAAFEDEVAQDFGGAARSRR